jgi:hypothetical protein
MFENLKVGDEVYLVVDNDLIQATKQRIKEITEKRVILGVYDRKDMSFDIKTGKVTKLSQYIKNHKSNHKYSKIMIVNDETTKLINDKKFKNQIIEKLKTLFVSDMYLSKEIIIKRDSLSLEQLVKASEILEIEVK